MTVNTRQDTTFLSEQKEILKHVLDGLTRTEIAKRMNFSRSAISYRINILFEDYHVANRHEFVLAYMNRIINKLRYENKFLKEMFLKKFELGQEAKNSCD